MAEDSTDTTSFASILAGVKRLRDETNADDIEARHNRTPTQHVEPAETVTSKVTQRPFSEGERIVPISLPRGAAQPNQIGPSNATKYQRPSMNRTMINNSARRTTFPNIQVSSSQKGNPLINALKIPFEYNEKLRNCDYMINTTTFIIFLSLKYHKLHPEYIYSRVKKLNGPHGNVALNNNMKVLLCLVDVDNNDEIVKELNKICILNDLSLVLAWSFEESANYLNYLKQLESSNTHTSIRGVTNEDDYYQTLTNTLTSIKQINKTDSVNLITKYGSFKDLVTKSNEEDLNEVQGMGRVKVAKFLASLDSNFILNKTYVKSAKPVPEATEEAKPAEDDDYEAFLKEMGS